MSRRTPARRRSAVSRHWCIVRRFLRCYRGCAIEKGERVLWTRAGYWHTPRCTACALLDYGMEPPLPDPYVPGQYDEGKARQVKESE